MFRNIFNALFTDIGDFGNFLSATQAFNAGNEFYGRGEYQGALEAYDEAIRLKPEDNKFCAKAYNNKGNALIALSRYGDALLSYDEAIRIKPDFADAYVNKGIALYNLSRYEEALPFYDEAISIKPEDNEFCARAYYNKGNALSNLSRYTDALLSYDEAIRLKQDYASAYYSKGLALSNLARYEDALLFYDEAIRLDPNDAEAHNNKGNALLTLSRYKEALPSYDEAIRLKPDLAEAYNNKGITLGNLSKYTESLLFYGEAIRRKPEDNEFCASAYVNKGHALDNLSKYEDAIASFNEAIRLNDKLILAYLGKAKTLQKTIEDDRLLSTKTSFSSFSKKTKITKEEKLVREQEILDCLNKAYEISQEKSLLNSNELSQDNINAMNKMFDERSKLLEKFKDLSHEVNALKEDGIDTSTIDKNLSDIQTKIIEVLEASEEKTQELLESKREGRTSLSSSLRITSNEDLQKHLAPIYEMMEQMRLDNLRLREEFEFGKKTLEEQQLKLESLEEKGQIVLEKNQVSLEDKLDEQEEIASVGEDQALLPNLTSARIIQNQYRSPVSNNTSIVANAYEESIRDQRDTNSSMHKTYVISKITYDNPLLNFLAKEENKEIEEKIIQKHGARDLSKLIDIFDPINSTEQDRAESQATEPLPFSILGKVPEESSELDQG